MNKTNESESEMQTKRAGEREFVTELILVATLLWMDDDHTPVGKAG